jgi:hypothetical protein
MAPAGQRTLLKKQERIGALADLGMMKTNRQLLVRVIGAFW